ncbi:hypothetical protein CEP51_001812 [Fusarium floridanum]|uniref:Uncharacterized protein n=1 Tax=Fusarium floridanum TaxID=1325733 RepID=A0A428SER5_9HYPO|nr:hypothetical protein CEP51_001812 [Fusarium floridanum]
METEACRDIRSEAIAYDPVAKALWLQRQWPNYPGAPESGIACLTMVLRAIYARLPKGWEEKMRSKESENPLLRHAWLKFAGDPECDGSALNQVVSDLYGQPFETSQTKYAHELRFESLVNSEHMMKTLWCQEEFRIFQQLLWCHHEYSEGWVAFDPDDAPDNIITRLGYFHPVPSPGVIAVRISPHSDLSEEVSKVFGQESDSPGHFTVLARPAAPSFMYMTAIITEGRGQVTIDMLRSFKLACGCFEETDSGVVWKEAVQSVNYTIVALVRYRRFQQGCDRIRLFDSLGQNIQPLHDVGQYADQEWEADALNPGSKLFLLFAQNDYFIDDLTLGGAQTETQIRAVKNQEMLQRALDRVGWVREVTPRTGYITSPATGRKGRETNVVVID